MATTNSALFAIVCVVFEVRTTKFIRFFEIIYIYKTVYKDLLMASNRKLFMNDITVWKSSVHECIGGSEARRAFLFCFPDIIEQHHFVVTKQLTTKFDFVNKGIDSSDKVRE